MAGKELPDANHSMKVKEVKNDLNKKKIATTPEKKSRRSLSFFPLPHDHLDDIFLSSGGIE